MKHKTMCAGKFFNVIIITTKQCAMETAFTKSKITVHFKIGVFCIVYSYFINCLKIYLAGLVIFESFGWHPAFIFYFSYCRKIETKHNTNNYKRFTLYYKTIFLYVYF